MFNNLKSQEFFDPKKVCGPIHIVGCGAIGGAVAEYLCRLGVAELHLWDMDAVSAHNLGNQVYRDKDITEHKTVALRNILKEINPDITIFQHDKITVGSTIAGYIFLCIDNIDVRRELCTKWKMNPNIKFITDARMRLTDGVIYSANWYLSDAKDNLINSMQFTHDEALAETPVSACGLVLSVICTPRALSALMVANWIKFINLKEYNRFIQFDAYKPFIDSYKA